MSILNIFRRTSRRGKKKKKTRDVMYDLIESSVERPDNKKY